MRRGARYSRIDAIRDYGYNIDWSVLERKTVLVAGIGGLGTIFAEIMARMGVGKLILVDMDIVEEVNLNRLFYRVQDLGKPKAEAAAIALKAINPDIEIIPLVGDIMRLDETEKNFHKSFEYWVKQSDLVANCLDNIPARMYLNEVCVRNNVPYVNAGAARNGLSGSVHLVIPYKTPCAQCIGQINLGKDRSPHECAASLPTTMAIIASLQAQFAIKYLVGFGKIPPYISYNALTDEFFVFKTKRDPKCAICGVKREVSNSEAVEVIDKLIDNLSGKE